MQHGQQDDASLPATEPKRSRSRRVVLLAALVVAAGLFLTWAIPAGYRLYMSRRPIPEYANQAALEMRYAEELSLLAKLAADPREGGSLDVFQGEILKMKSRPEIIAAKLIFPGHFRWGVFDKHSPPGFKEATCYAEPGPGGKVDTVTIWYYEFKDGKTVEAVEYRGEVADARGRKAGYILRIDLAKLKQIAEREPG